MKLNKHDRLLTAAAHAVLEHERTREFVTTQICAAMEQLEFINDESTREQSSARIKAALASLDDAIDGFDNYE